MNYLINYKSNPWNFLNDFSYPRSMTVGNNFKEFLRYDIEETDKNFIMSFDLPGVNRKDLTLEVKDSVLTLSGERKGETKKDSFTGRFYGSFHKEFTLPAQVDSDQVEASFENGVLQIMIPKAEVKKGRKIEISSLQPTKEEESVA